MRRISTTRAGVVKAVDGVSFDLAQAKSSGWSASPGSGKTVTGFSILGLVDPPGRIVGGSVKLAGRELVGLAPRGLRTLRGRHIAMVFQDPMTTLNPVLTIGNQMQLATSRPMEGRRGGGSRPRRSRLSARVGIPDAASPAGRVSARVLRRHAPACRHRHRASASARHHCLRRADDGARRFDPGPDPGRDEADSCATLAPP